MPSAQQSALLAAALNYARRFPVFPCGVDKKPLTDHGFLDASQNVQQIRDWWSRWPDASIGMPTGDASGVDAIDVDTYRDGARTLQRLEEKLKCTLPPTLTSQTGGGGQHRFFKHRGLNIRSGANVLGQGLDVRGIGGYVILPPSPHTSGKNYAWVDLTIPVADLPEPFVKILEKPIRTATPTNGANGELKIQSGQRHDTLVRLAGALRGRGMSSAAIEAALVADNLKRCDPPLDENEVRRIASDIGAKPVGLPPSGLPRAIIPPSPFAKTEPLPAESMPTTDLTNRLPEETTREDSSNKERFVRKYAGEVHHATSTKRWLVWEVETWRDDATGDVVERAQQVARAIYRECGEIEDDKERKAMAKFAEKSLNNERLMAMLNLAKNDPRIRVDDYGAVFDTHPELVNFWNGTFDLNTGELREHRREDYLTKIVKYDFAEDIVSPRWESFVEHTFGELAGAVQTCAGYSFTGYVNEKCVFFLIGPTNTGKTTFLTALREVFRQYTAEIMVSSLMHSRLNSEGNNTLADLADLCGARFAVTSETEEGQRLHEAKLKRLAQGMGTIRTARKYEKPFSFPATHKLWVDANHRPVITGTDDAIWNRLICIPCPNVVRNPNKNLLAEMVAEAPGIISWVIQGMKRWLKEGLQIPDELRAARDEWRSNSDRMGDWLDECCTLNPEAWTASEILFDSWKPWCEKRRIEPGGMPSFITKLIDRGFRSERRRVGGGSSPKVRGVWGIQPPTTSFG